MTPDTKSPAGRGQTALDDQRLAELAGGWRREMIDVGWTHIEMALPVDPDSLLGDERVLAANQRDDYMPYWASLWPAAHEMAAALQHLPWSAGAPVLELGCGLGLVGIAGLKQGWDVLMTDYEPKATAAALFNAELNGFPAARASLLDWRDPPSQCFDAIIACDVLYEKRSHEPLLRLLQAILSDDGCCWIGDPGRTPVVEFYHAIVEAGFSARIFSADGAPQSFPIRGRFQLLKLTRPVADE